MGPCPKPYTLSKISITFHVFLESRPLSSFSSLMGPIWPTPGSPLMIMSVFVCGSECVCVCVCTGQLQQQLLARRCGLSLLASFARLRHSRLALNGAVAASSGARARAPSRSSRANRISLATRLVCLAIASYLVVRHLFGFCLTCITNSVYNRLDYN